MSAKLELLNPAEVAAKEALENVSNCIRERKSFVFEAGAGAGKTYSLIQCLKNIIRERGNDLIRNNQCIACITYTNVAKEEIRSRTDSHPAVMAETIHSFSWSLLKNFQDDLRKKLPTIETWASKPDDLEKINKQTVVYDLGYQSVDDYVINLGHDDVIALMVKFMEEKKFRAIFVNKYPVLFIDEYQDTNKNFADALLRHFVNKGEGPLIGFFGDHWQKIYGESSCGKIEHPNLSLIDKKANFRSERLIVEFLNRMRPELPQNESAPTSKGEISVHHTNNWVGTRRSGAHWDGDIPVEEAHAYLQYTKELLIENGWDFSVEKTKVLMLTHNVLAAEQGYRTLAGVFNRTESYIKKEDPYIAYFADIIEPVCIAYLKGKFGEVFSILDGMGPNIRRHEDKILWKNDLDSLIEIRQSGTIRQVIDYLCTSKHLKLSNRVKNKELKYKSLILKDNKDPDEIRFIEKVEKLGKVAYSEVSALVNFIENKTPFATDHGVKGAEFENVLVVVGRGWSRYNFGQMLDWVYNGIPNGKLDSYERNRNLFYVACSRPKKRLALLFTQKLSTFALKTLNEIYGIDEINALPNIK